MQSFAFNAGMPAPIIVDPMYGKTVGMLTITKGDTPVQRAIIPLARTWEALFSIVIARGRGLDYRADLKILNGDDAMWSAFEELGIVEPGTTPSLDAVITASMLGIKLAMKSLVDFDAAVTEDLKKLDAEEVAK